MVYENIDRFMAHFVAGSGLLLAGGVNFAGARFATIWRIAANAVVAGGTVGLAVDLFDTTRFVLPAIAILLPSLALLHLLGSAVVVRGLQNFCQVASRSLVRTAIVLVIGLVLIFSSTIVFDERESELADEDMSELTRPTSVPALTSEPDLHARTDRGESISLLKPLEPRDDIALDIEEKRFLIKTTLQGQYVHKSPADDTCNCHGWVFTGGRAWVTGSLVQGILDQNGYVAVTDPRPGDLAIYRLSEQICHTAIVRVANPGEPAIVEGKWGWMGVYLHPVDKSLYGLAVTFYRSPRPGHILRGLEANATATPRHRIR